MRAIDKLDRLGVEGVRALLGAGRKDDSGDFTDGAGLNNFQIEKIMGFVDANSQIDAQLAREASRARDAGSSDYSSLVHSARDYASPRNRDEIGMRGHGGKVWNRHVLDYLAQLVNESDVGFSGVKELEDIEKLMSAQGYLADRIIIDPSVVRGLGYYTGPVYEAELTFEIEDEKGRPRQFGSVAGGGRYDDLVKRFTGQAVPATGVSIGVDRLLAALRMKGRLKSDTAGPVVITVMDRDRMGDYQAMATTLRNAGIRAEVYLGNPKNFGNQLKYADKRASPVAIIQGSDEADRGVVQIKDLVLGAKIAETATHEEWKDQPAQFECSIDHLVTKVREILDR